MVISKIHFLLFSEILLHFCLYHMLQNHRVPLTIVFGHSLDIHSHLGVFLGVLTESLPGISALIIGQDLYL